MEYNQVYILLGSNRGNSWEYLAKAIELVSLHAGNVFQQSSVYETEPWGFSDEQNFLNQAIEIRTEQSPEELLKTLNAVEEWLGRKRTGNKYESRTIDIDILFFNNEIIETESLKIPHPLMHQRKFVLEPLAEIAGFFIHPVLKKTVGALLLECSDKTAVWRTGNRNGQ